MVSHSHYTRALSQITPRTILIVGDLILDQYTYGSSKRISPEAPVPVVLVERQELKAGGAGNVALNLAKLGMKPRIVSRIGRDEKGQIARSLLEGEGIDCRFLFTDITTTTSVKNRVIVSSQQLIRLDDERKDPLHREVEEEILSSIDEMLADVDLVAISDYAKGFLTDKVLRAIIGEARRRSIPCITDPKGTDFRKYSGSTIIKPNFGEAMSVFGEQAESLEEAVELIFKRVEVDVLLVTRSEKGISLFYRDGFHQNFPVVPKEVRDVTGAGDTVLAVLAASLASGVSLQEAVPLANVAASCAIEKIGCAAITLTDIAMRLIEQNPTGKICNEEVFKAVASSVQPDKLLIIRIPPHGNGMSHEQLMRLHVVLSKKSPDKLAVAYVEEESPNEEFLEFLASLERIALVVFKSSHHTYQDSYMGTSESHGALAAYQEISL